MQDKATKLSYRDHFILEMIDNNSRFSLFLSRIKANKFANDSFWAVFGNGLGNFFLLVAGIIIARLLGKDLYGEYGVVKTTMFYMAAVATFGGHYTSTKYVADYLKRDPSQVRAIVNASLKISFVAGLILFVLLLVFSQPLASFLKEPTLSTPFRYLGIILLVRALATTEGGIIGGFKEFKSLGISNIVSGAILFVLGAILTYFWGLIGSLIALLLSQVALFIVNSIIVHKLLKPLPASSSSYVKEIVHFSIPVVMQELTYSLSSWISTLIIANYASMGELGIYTAASQWNAIILFIPGLLTNVILSYLSDTGDNQNHKQMFRKMLLVNLICAVAPFLVVFAFSGIIASFYGDTFDNLQLVINVTIFSTVFTSLATVYQTNLLSLGRNWLLFLARLLRDSLTLLLIYLVLRGDSTAAALSMAKINVLMAIMYLGSLVLLSKYQVRTKEI